MSSAIAWNYCSKIQTAMRAAMRSLRGVPAFWVAGAAMLGTACSSSSDAAGTSGTTTGDAKFDACVATLTLCKTSEMNTAAKMEAAMCKASEFIPIPLKDGTSYGPVTIEGGPYGAKIEWNQGAGTEFVNTVNVASETTLCNPTGIDTFAEPSQVTDDLKNLRDIDATLYTIFRPACMKDGETYPVITWANGTCGYTHGYALLLGTVASHGFVVVASNSVWTNTAPTDSVQERALDYAKALNEDKTSMFYKKLNMDKVGAMGHSQGAAATIKAASDPRVKSVIFWNYGTTNAVPFLTVSADHDVGGETLDSLKGLATGSTEPGAWIYYHQILNTGGNTTGHLVLMEQPDRVWKMAVDWWKWQLNGDTEAKKTFAGSGCGLCAKTDGYDYGVNDNLK